MKAGSHDLYNMSTEKLPDRIVLFDGYCNLCSRLVTFLIRHDPAGRLYFASSASATGQRLLEEAGLSMDAAGQSLIYLEEGRRHLQSEAALRIAAQLRRPYRWVRVLRFIPVKLRDRIYRTVAANRYRWFGKRTTCRVARPDEAGRFL